MESSRGTDRVSTLWRSTYEKYLRDPLWIQRDAYDAGHELMVPLHAAFRKGRKDWQSQFAHHVRAFTDQKDALTDEDLDRLHYEYFLSQYLVLALEADRPGLIPPGLPEFLAEDMHRLWIVKPAWMWDRAPFEGGMKARLGWKLSVSPQTLPYDHYRAIFDHENLLFGIAADLRRYEQITGRVLPRSGSLADVTSTALTTWRARFVDQPNGGVLFQPGVWWDHPDYRYAGQEAERAGLKPSPVRGISEDSAHSLRWPLWLRSFRSIYPAASGDGQYVRHLTDALGIQLRSVLVPPSNDFNGWRARNYMDGRNGIYRWEYDTVANSNDGSGPFELTNSLWVGWWTFLGGEATAMYADMGERYPLPQDVISLYVGPNTTRDRNPLVRDPDAFTNGLRELNARLAGLL